MSETQKKRVVREAIVVEGRYDTIRLRSLLDAPIVETGGFQLFKDPAQLRLLRRLARTRGLVVLTDSDSAGFLIRDYIASAVPKEYVRHAYIPARLGKERRKSVPGKEGLLGVEGMDEATLLAVLARAGVSVDAGAPQSCGDAPYMTKARLYADGLSGGPNSHAKREALCEALSLPPRLSSTRLIEVLNAAFPEEEYLAALGKINA